MQLYIVTIRAMPKKPLIIKVFFSLGHSGQGDTLFLLSVSIENRRDKLLLRMARCHGVVLTASLIAHMAMEEQMIMKIEFTIGTTNAFRSPKAINTSRLFFLII